MRHHLNHRTLLRAALLAIASAALYCGIALAQNAFQTSLPSQDANIAGVVAEITEVKRQDGVLTLRMRLRSTTGERVDVRLIDRRNYDAYYLTANSKKYFILRDAEKVPLAPQADGGGTFDAVIPKGGAYTWWSKYPAPPADVKKMSYYTPITPPFDNVPITD